MIGVEALLRWNSSRDGILTAGRFFKTAETLGLCGLFSDWAIRQACSQMKDWIDRGLFTRQKDFRMSVNLCAEQLAAADLPDRISAVLRETGLSPKALALDMAEDSIRYDEPQIAQNLRLLRQMGIALHLDDFSQGFASLQKASDIPFDCLKIDQMMTSVFLESPSGEALLDTLLNLSHVLGLRVIAEGVENQQAFAWLRAHACDSMQGFYFCKPLPAIEMEMLLSLKAQT
jgi:EAL domain-containing protein (putative c-di-GMP-specific phosphodiesterase class I)